VSYLNSLEGVFEIGRPNADGINGQCEPCPVSQGSRELSFVDKDAKEDFVVVPFPHGNLTHCSENWLKSINGLGLLHATLGSGAFDENKNTYWTQALMQVSRQLCHSWLAEGLPYRAACGRKPMYNLGEVQMINDPQTDFYFGFNILNIHGRPLVILGFDSHEEAASAHKAMKEIVAHAKMIKPS
jgi:hypothetical protein